MWLWRIITWLFIGAFPSRFACLFACLFFEPRLMCGFVGVGTAHGSAAHCCPLQGEMGKAGAVWLWVGTDPLTAAL